MPEKLVLVPTPTEMRRLEPHLIGVGGVVAEMCGFGPIAAAATTANLIARHRPQEVMLVGIAGAVGDGLKIGSASKFSSVACYGVGVGWADLHTPAAEIGWCQLAGDGLEPVGDYLMLDESAPDDRLLMSVCSASGAPADVQRYRDRYPQTIAEDMEGFGVAMACHLSNTRLSIIRGISNIAGDRDKSNWQVEQAMEAATTMTLEHLRGDSEETRI